MRARNKPNRVPAVLAFLSIGQIAAGLTALAVAATILGVPTTCVQPSPLLQRSESGHAVYVDLQSVLARFGTACIEAATTMPTSTEISAPFVAEASRRRNDRAAADPTYFKRTDPELNRNRINFLFFGYGETYEPPYGPDFKGSINVLSLDLSTFSAATITLNHDIRAPEVERYRQLTDKKGGPTRIDQAYPVGGFDVMRLSVEDATGLTIDFQLAMADSVIREAVDELLGNLTVDAPFEFDAMPIYYGGERYEARHYARGEQTMDGLAALQFIKALNAGKYDARQELTVRKQIVLKALLDATKRSASNPLFWTRAVSFLRNQTDRKSLAFDFDPADLLLRSIEPSMAGGLAGSVRLPTLGQSLYIVDERSGDGGVEWVTGSSNPIVRRDVENGVYVDASFSVPKDSADPYAPDLVAHYWGSVRALVKQRLSTCVCALSDEKK